MPTGVKIYFADEAERKWDLEQKLISLFRSRGYDFIIPPTFGFYNNLVQVFDSKFQNQVYKFVDRNGEVLALRPDFTAQLVRIIATSLKNHKLPIRLAYSGNVFLQTIRQEGKLREFYQTGIELFSQNKLQTDIEIILLLNAVLKTLPFSNYKINIGNAGFVSRLIEKSGFSDKKAEIIDNIKLRNYDYLREICPNSNLPAIVNLIGDISVVKKAQELFGRDEELENLISVYNFLENEGLGNVFVFDLSEIHNLPYYSSTIYDAYIPELGTKIISGGRYDRLCEEYGLTVSGAGLAINIDAILESIEITANSRKTIVLFGKKSPRIEMQLRDKGFVAEYYAEPESVEKIKEYANARNAELLLKISDKIVRYNLTSNEIEEFDINSL